MLKMTANKMSEAKSVFNNQVMIWGVAFGIILVFRVIGLLFTLEVAESSLWVS